MPERTRPVPMERTPSHGFEKRRPSTWGVERVVSSEHVEEKNQRPVSPAHMCSHHPFLVQFDRCRAWLCGQAEGSVNGAVIVPSFEITAPLRRAPWRMVWNDGAPASDGARLPSTTGCFQAKSGNAACAGDKNGGTQSAEMNAQSSS